MRTPAIALAASLVLQFALAGAAGAQTTPKADAGPDLSVGCVGPNGTPINLSGIGSSVGPGFSYLWSAPGVTFSDPTSLTPIGAFSIGATEVTLTVTFTDPVTGSQTSASDTALVTVSDTTPPMLFAVADPAQLWPPNHKLVDVHVDVNVFDVCDATPAVELVSLTSSEPDNGTGDGNTGGDVQGAEPGTDDVDFQLRAERSGPGPGRSYSALYRATDLAGNHTDALVTVVVPHDMGHHGGSQGNADGEKQIKLAEKAAVKAAKAQLKAARAAEKAAQKAYRAALRAAGP
ncbi:MAG TPA: hypothetical protein VEI82_12890 [Myxococcota bacterium]|nr:hypothetical protein [Myxococcota bacterium]